MNNDAILRRLRDIKLFETHDQKVRCQISEAVCGAATGHTYRFLDWLIAEFEARAKQDTTHGE